MTKNIIFDLGGVLIDLNMSGMHRVCMSLGVTPELFFVPSSAENTSTVCQGMSTSRIITDYQVGQMTTEEFTDVILSQCRPGTTREQLIEAWNSCLGDIPAERINLLRQLRQQGYGIYLLSNTNDLHWRNVEARYFQDKSLFDQIFLSHEMHLAKPDPEIYRETVRRIGCAASECLFIDDSSENAEAARREGLGAAWLNLEKEDVLSLVRSLGLIS